MQRSKAPAADIKPSGRNTGWKVVQDAPKSTINSPRDLAKVNAEPVASTSKVLVPPNPTAPLL